MSILYPNIKHVRTSLKVINRFLKNPKLRVILRCNVLSQYHYDVNCFNAIKTKAIQEAYATESEQKWLNSAHMLEELFTRKMSDEVKEELGTILKWRDNDIVSQKIGFPGGDKSKINAIKKSFGEDMSRRQIKQVMQERCVIMLLQQIEQYTEMVYQDQVIQKEIYDANNDKGKKKVDAQSDSIKSLQSYAIGQYFFHWQFFVTTYNLIFSKENVFKNILQSKVNC